MNDLIYKLDAENALSGRCGMGVNAYKVIHDIDPVDPETLPIVKELRAEIERMNKGIENLSKNVENAYKQRDGAVEQLRGICRSCKNYTENHCCGPCADCKYEYYAYRFADAKDRWEWIGLKDENNSR